MPASCMAEMSAWVNSVNLIAGSGSLNAQMLTGTCAGNSVLLAITDYAVRSNTSQGEALMTAF